MKGNAVDFLTKPVCVDDLEGAVKHSLAADAEAREERRQKRELLTRYGELTPGEREVLALVVRGLLNKQIAFELGTVERTIKANRAQIMTKMRVRSIVELVSATERLGKDGIYSKPI
jgi:FixJ family two-component response regulator